LAFLGRQGHSQVWPVGAPSEWLSEQAAGALPELLHPRHDGGMSIGEEPIEQRRRRRRRRRG